MVLELNEKTFNEEIAKSTPILIDFWATWCGPCRMLSPVFEKIASAKEFSGKLRFAKINVDDNQSIANKLGLRGIPCMILYSEGKEVDRITGFSGEAGLKAKISELLKKA